MEFQSEDIAKLAKLARIELSSHDAELFRQQLTSVLRYVEQVASADIYRKPKEEPERFLWREDETGKMLAKPKDLLHAAPNQDEDHVTVLSVK